jgi:hypothetical protein
MENIQRFQIKQSDLAIGPCRQLTDGDIKCIAIFYPPRDNPTTPLATRHNQDWSLSPILIFAGGALTFFYLPLFY